MTPIRSSMRESLLRCGLGHERGDDVLHVLGEIGSVGHQVRSLSAQVEKAQVSSIGEPCPVAPLGAGESKLSVETRNEVDAPFGHALEHRPKGGVIGGGEK